MRGSVEFRPLELQPAVALLTRLGARHPSAVAGPFLQDLLQLVQSVPPTAALVARGSDATATVPSRLNTNLQSTEDMTESADSVTSCASKAHRQVCLVQLTCATPTESGAWCAAALLFGAAHTSATCAALLPGDVKPWFAVLQVLW